MTSWKISLPCTKDEAERFAGETPELDAFDPPPVLMVSGPDPQRPDQWRLDAFFESEPDAAAVAAVRALVPSARGVEAAAEPVGDEDWLRLSQRELEPILAGRFCVHTSAHRGDVREGTLAIEIDAGRAFGTGHHETTTGCLEALDALKRQGFVARNLIDVGTGTGLLAFAALKLWPQARATASDIAPVSIEVTRENAAINGFGLGATPGRIELAVAAGLDHPKLRQRAPYDLIVANILAGPLVALAPSLAPALVPGGRLVLAGLLQSQARAVARAYAREGLRTLFSVTRGEWPTLVLRRPRG